MTLPTGLPVGALAERGRRILVTRGVEPVADPARLAAAFATLGLTSAQTPEGRAAIELLFAAVCARDAAAAATAANLLLGRGPGLTPEGDDLLAATAAVLAAAAPDGARLLAALVPPDIRARTTALSATLLELAASRSVAEPLWAALDLAASDESWRASLRRLERLGATTGPAYAAAAGAVAFLVGQ